MSLEHEAVQSTPPRRVSPELLGAYSGCGTSVEVFLAGDDLPVSRNGTETSQDNDSNIHITDLPHINDPDTTLRS